MSRWTILGLWMSLNRCFCPQLFGGEFVTKAVSQQLGMAGITLLKGVTHSSCWGCKANDSFWPPKNHIPSSEGVRIELLSVVARTEIEEEA